MTDDERPEPFDLANLPPQPVLFTVDAVMAKRVKGKKEPKRTRTVRTVIATDPLTAREQRTKELREAFPPELGWVIESMDVEVCK